MPSSGPGQPDSCCQEELRADGIAHVDTHAHTGPPSLPAWAPCPLSPWPSGSARSRVLLSHTVPGSSLINSVSPSRSCKVLAGVPAARAKRSLECREARAQSCSAPRLAGRYPLIVSLWPPELAEGRAGGGEGGRAEAAGAVPLVQRSQPGAQREESGKRSHGCHNIIF